MAACLIGSILSLPNKYIYPTSWHCMLASARTLMTESLWLFPLSVAAARSFSFGSNWCSGGPCTAWLSPTVASIESALTTKGYVQSERPPYWGQKIPRVSSVEPELKKSACVIDLERRFGPPSGSRARHVLLCAWFLHEFVAKHPV